MNMYDKERIVYQLERTRKLSLQMIDRVPQDQWLEMPTGITHVAWNVGHLAVAEYFLGLFLTRGPHEQDQSLIPETYFELYGYGSVASNDPSTNPRPEEILDVLAAVHTQVLMETKERSAESFTELCQFPEDGEFDHHPIFEDVGGALEWLTYHEHVHIGSIGLLRRELGSKPIEYMEESRNGKRFR